MMMIVSFWLIMLLFFDDLGATTILDNDDVIH